MERPELAAQSRVWLESIVTIRKAYASYPPDAALHPLEDDPDLEVPVQPHDTILLNYRVYRGRGPLSRTALLTASIANGVMPPMHQQINLPGFLDQATGVLELSKWPKPFPGTLLGYHDAIIDLWVPDPNGQPLPAEVQTSPPDSRKFVRAMGDWARVYVQPGCRGEGGLEWSELKSFSVTPATVRLDPSGKVIAAGEQVTVKWECSDAGLPATQFGYPGSWHGVVVLGLGTPVASPLQTGQLVALIGGMPYWQGMGVTIAEDFPRGCAFAPQTVPLVGVIPNKPPPEPGLADLVHLDSWREPAFPGAQEGLTVHFRVANMGGTATGPFSARMELDAGIRVESIDVPSVAPGSAVDIFWPLNSGLAVGGHWIYCKLDVANAVAEVTKSNNTGYHGIVIA